MNTQIQIVKRITQGIAVFWIIMKIICIKLWLKDRNYPLVPVIDIPAWAHIVLLIVFFVLAICVICKPGNKYLLLLLTGIELFSLLADQNRLQPWHYQFIFSFFIIAFNFKDKGKTLQGLVLIMVFTYFFSGLQKLNPGFIDSVWSVYILRVFLKLPGFVIDYPLVQWAGFIMPAIEIAGAVGLLFTRTMKAAAYGLVGMHVFLLIFLGPFGINYNVVVWPWNLIMILLIWILFIKNKYLLRPVQCRSAANYVVAFFWILMPVAGLFGYWDKFLSSAMYSGRDKLKQFYFEDRNRIPPELSSYAFYKKDNTSARIVLTDWCVQELGVAAVKEKRVLNSIVKQLNERYAFTGTIFVLTEGDY